MYGRNGVAADRDIIAEWEEPAQGGGDFVPIIFEESGDLIDHRINELLQRNAYIPLRGSDP